MIYKSKKYLNTKEVKLALKIQDCDLAHLRNAGKLKFTKKGNAFMYSKESLEEFKTNVNGSEKKPPTKKIHS